LRQNLVDHFGVEDLELLCDDLGVDHESVPGYGGGKAYWAGEIVRYFERRGRLDELIAALQQRRPAVQWMLNTQEASQEKSLHADTDHPAEPWWSQLPGGDAATAAGGDVIIATIGAGATGVAVGKNISQQIQTTLGPATPSDPQLIEQAVQQVSDALKDAALDGAIKPVADFQLGLLKGELLKTEGALPSANTITGVGGWLLQQAPVLRPALAGLFGLPATGRVLIRAGDAAVTWAKQTFGG
jgi:hypothetical protein